MELLGILIIQQTSIFKLWILNRQCSWPDLLADPIRDQPCPGAPGGWPRCPGRWGEAAGGEVHGAVRVPAGGRPGGLRGHSLTAGGHQGVHQQDQLQTCGVSHYNPTLLLITFILLNCRYDYNLKIFYFCDIKPLTNSLQCYKYVAESKIVSLCCTTRIEWTTYDCI